MIRCFAVALSVLAVSVAHAQTGVMSGYVGTPQPGMKASVPVAIAFERKTMQTLADGTHISRTTHEWLYRDAEGRTRTEFEINSPAGTPEAPRTNVIIFDPVAGQTLSWMTGPYQQQTYNMTQTSRPYTATDPPTAINPLLRPAPVAPTVVSAPPAPPRNVLRASTHREDLGMQEVQGAPCKATRTTTVYPIDMLGNDRPIAVVRESCNSREFGRILSERQDDPRTGVRTLTVTSLSRTDPDPALFQPPPGYTVRPMPTAGPKAQ